MEMKSLADAVGKLAEIGEYFGFVMLSLWYGPGDGGPWFFPEIFNGGNPNLECSSEDFFSLLSDNQFRNQRSILTQIMSMSQLGMEVFKEIFARDFYSKLGCIVDKEAKYKESAEVISEFQKLLFSMSLYHQLTSTSNKSETNSELLKILDKQIGEVWDEIGKLTEEVLNVKYYFS